MSALKVIQQIMRFVCSAFILEVVRLINCSFASNILRNIERKYLNIESGKKTKVYLNFKIFSLFLSQQVICLQNMTCLR